MIEKIGDKLYITQYIDDSHDYYRRRNLDGNKDKIIEPICLCSHSMRNIQMDFQNILYYCARCGSYLQVKIIEGKTSFEFYDCKEHHLYLTQDIIIMKGVYKDNQTNHELIKN